MKRLRGEKSCTGSRDNASMLKHKPAEIKSRINRLIDLTIECKASARTKDCRVLSPKTNREISSCLEGVTNRIITHRRTVAEIRKMHLQRSPLVCEMSRLSEDKQLFDPAPICQNDSRYPIEQMKHLRSSGRLSGRDITVHAVRPSRIWKRNRRHFELLHQEEKDFFSVYNQPGKPLKLIHHAWHGAPSKNIKGILECGFLSAPQARVGRVYGHGIYLATEDHADYSMRDRFSAPDTAGFKYILLCEVLPGTVEASTRNQTHPTSNEVHSGVDQLPAPSMHVFFTYDMNVRISPKYVVCIHPCNLWSK